MSDLMSISSKEIEAALDDITAISNISWQTPVNTESHTSRQSQQKEQRGKNWLITVNNYKEKRKLIPDQIFLSRKGKHPQLERLAGQYEIGTEGTAHVHLFAVFQSQKLFHQVVELARHEFGNHPNVKYVKSTKADIRRAWEYVTKSETRDCPDDWVIRWNAPSLGSSSRSVATSATTNTRTVCGKRKGEEYYDLLYVRYPGMQIKDIFEATDREEDKILLATMPGNIKSNHAAWLHNERTKNAVPIKNVIILYGAAGTGKTEWIRRNLSTFDLDPELHTKSIYYHSAPCGKWTNVGDEPIYVLDEFAGKRMELDFLLQMSDVGKPAPTMQAKGSLRKPIYHTLVITSNYHPASWYRRAFTNNPARWTALARRVTKCLYFPELRPDGTRNAYHENSEEEAYEAYYEEERLLEINSYALIVCAAEKMNLIRNPGYANGYYAQDNPLTHH